MACKRICSRRAASGISNVAAGHYRDFSFCKDRSHISRCSCMHGRSDAEMSARAGQTCCCMRDFFGYCFAWACCPLKEATCCDDHIHCCPNSLPVCDTVAARCLASAGAGYEGSVPWSTKSPAQQVCIPAQAVKSAVCTAGSCFDALCSALAPVCSGS